MNTAPDLPQSAEPPGPDARLLGAAQDRGNYTDDAIIAGARRLIALRDLHIAQRDHKPTRAIWARLRAYTAVAL
jgi:hypothetical protein